MATPNIQQMPGSRRYFLSYPPCPPAPVRWVEISRDEYRAVLQCLARPEGENVEGVRVVSIPTEVVPVAPLVGALFTLLTLPYKWPLI